jgi:uncharacterized protein involved in response to NO
MNQDEEHLRLLSIFHYVCAGITALISCFPVFHLIIGLVMVFSPGSFDHGKSGPPAWFGGIMIAISGLIILAGWTFSALQAWTGSCLKQRKHYTFCFVMACVACTFMPFGTALGVFSIIVLSRPTVKALFKRAPLAPPVA